MRKLIVSLITVGLFTFGSTFAGAGDEHNSFTPPGHQKHHWKHKHHKHNFARDREHNIPHVTPDDFDDIHDHEHYYYDDDYDDYDDYDDDYDDVDVRLDDDLEFEFDL